jgi:hypothetical protein
MTMTTPRPFRRALLALLALCLLASPALAGPPLLCFPIDNGGAPSLPWQSGGWKGLARDYDRARLVPDTLALLGPDVPVLARMETLRRAALYAADSRSGQALVAALEARAAKAGKAEHALALFDLGYGTATVAQAGVLTGGSRASAASAYAKVQQALRERGSDPAMEYAAALINHDGVHRDVAYEHLRRAVAGAPAGSPLARTLAAHQDMWGEALTRARAAAN